MKSITKTIVTALHDAAATIVRNNFIAKSLSHWSCNLSVGCLHGCCICYVPDTSTVKQASLLKSYKVEEPARDWGKYVLIRPWNQAKFMASLRKAERTPPSELNADGNRAVMMCSTTDPYQAIKHDDPGLKKMFQAQARATRRNALVAIRDHSSLNVRILTRGPLAREDFELMLTFGNRLMFGMSIPTLDPKILKVYEPNAPHPKKRLETLIAAHEAGIPTYVAIAPVYPECDRHDLRRTMEAVKAANPMTIFFEPVNIRRGIADRIKAEATAKGIEVDMAPFQSTETWAPYALKALHLAEEVAEEVGLSDRLHLWPDKALSQQSVLETISNPLAHMQWLHRWWDRISEWPGRAAP